MYNLSPTLFQKMSRLVLSLILATVIFSFSNTITYAATVTWDGGGVNNNWSTCANWNSGTPDTCPTSTDDVVFNSTSTKNSTVDASFGGVVRSVAINTGYSGTIDLARSLQTTNSFSQATGSYRGDGPLCHRVRRGRRAIS
jgi:hypothetical protein